MTYPFLPYGRQCLDDDDIAAVTAVLRGDWLTQGPAVENFERRLADRLQAAHAVACSSGTAALHLAALALDLAPGDAVVVPSLTFLATANAIRHAGAEVAFADVDAATGLMRAEHLEAALARAERAGWRPRAVFPVHLTGQTADMADIGRLAAERGLAVVEDACHALGAEYADGRPVGDGRHPACFSFHPVKAIAAGEGGAVTTGDAALAERLKRLRNHGMTRDAADPSRYAMAEPGFNYRLTDIQCALAASQLSKLDRFLARRRHLADLYDRMLAPLAPRVRPPARVSGRSGWHLYAARLDFPAIGRDRAAVMAGLRERGIGTQVHYIPVHTQPYYRERYGAPALPGAERYHAATLSLPLFPAMADADIDRVVSALAGVIG
ncbi:UDP-4-amino-4,6-dideoxy-N-acetyl-beta-L-altrosamine transaminase [Azospirillum sp.]|uniref:UDP-4-amino-4, 6-dideoxy-N-acetyl-beta-L-altrosamine transaminase n=1 Tax=Azospirillum sp. TaxID=34012 RepID=UPI002D3435D1|nr:UDP-4-amino-4,6-dideoxy-N-acetyl-beta-L-altrosamine transaminase [Azospirillum sp.]HYD70470.1 UDP-4-amino-4,6-dideoxy-N-acetyl-beta-L-altrosamine transaminase [Azospirillum sp.]